MTTREPEDPSVLQGHFSLEAEWDLPLVSLRDFGRRSGNVIDHGESRMDDALRVGLGGDGVSQGDDHS